MKKWISLLLCIALCTSITVTAHAAGRYVIDEAGLLTDSQISQLEETAAELQDQYQMDVVVLTLESLTGRDVQSAADDYYDENGYAEDGILFLLAMEEREWCITTSGSAVYALTDYGLYEIDNLVLPYLQAGDYYSAFETYQNALPKYINAYLSGDQIDGYVPEEDRYEGHTDVVYEEDSGIAASILLGCVVGLIVAGIAVIIMRMSMNTKRAQYSAGDYLKAGTYHLRANRDLFLYSQVTKTPRPQQQNNNNSGGGSGVHTSSSGRTHGGRSGKF